MDNNLEDAVRADVMSVSDEPHDWYAPHKFHPEAAVPEPYDTERGNILLKDVEFSTIECPECETEARKDERGTPVCPDCGILCVAPDRSDYQVIADPKTAERVDDNGNFIQ